jgi:hypothetical protein
VLKTIATSKNKIIQVGKSPHLILVMVKHVGKWNKLIHNQGVIANLFLMSTPHFTSELAYDL